MCLITLGELVAAPGWTPAIPAAVLPPDNVLSQPLYSPHCPLLLQITWGGTARGQEDGLYPTMSPACSTAPHLQLCHLLAGAKPIPQVSLMGLIGHQRKGIKKLAVHLHRDESRTARCAKWSRVG